MAKTTNSVDLAEWETARGTDIISEYDIPDINRTGQKNVIKTLLNAKVDNKDNLYSGLYKEKIQSGSTNSYDYEEQLAQWRQNIQLDKWTTTKLHNIIAPWDWRLGEAYTSTQSIGNKMPYGPEWVGSPSIFNPYALVRFDHIAGARHHLNALDDMDTIGFPGTWATKSIQKVDVKWTDADKQKGERQLTESEVPPDILAIYGKPTDKFKYFVDSDGNLYTDTVDENVEIWETKESCSYSGYEISEIQIQTKGRDDKKTARPGTNGGILGQFSQSVVESFWLEKFDGQKLNKQYWPKSISAESKKTLENEVRKEKEDNKKNDTTNNTKQNEYLALLDNRKKLYLFIFYESGFTDLLKVVTDKYRKDFEETRITKCSFAWREWIFKDFGIRKRYIPVVGKDSKQKLELIEPYVNELCNTDNWDGREQFTYDYSDFLYCKYLNLIPNNHLITLRRFPVPINDKATVPGQDDTGEFILPVSRAVTWLGDSTGNKLSDLLSYGLKINWKDLPSEVDKVEGNEQGAEDGPFAGISKVLGVISGQANFGSISGWDEQRAKFDPYSQGQYQNRVYGPVNVITGTKARDRGISSDNQMNIKFHYSLKSIGGVNPKAAMLDLLGNILTLTYNNADFWGGAIRYFPNKPAYPFLGGKRGMQAWYNGDVTGFIDSVGDQFSTALESLGSIFSDLTSNPIETLKKLASKGGQLGMAMFQRKRNNRPRILGFKALLTGEPVGEWHLTIGNPFNPIAMIGNLIITNTKISFSDSLGIDDFPEELIVEITLEHGRSRDKGDIESIFNRGGGRLYYSAYGQEVDAWNKTSATSNSKIDTSWKKGASSFRPSGPVGVNGGGRFSGYLSDNVGRSSGDAWKALGKSTKQVYNKSVEQARKLAFQMGVATK